MTFVIICDIFELEQTQNITKAKIRSEQDGTEQKSVHNFEIVDIFSLKVTAFID